MKSAINTGNVKAKFLEFEIEIESTEGDKDSVSLENFISFIQENNNILLGTDIQLRNEFDSWDCNIKMSKLGYGFKLISSLYSAN